MRIPAITAFVGVVASTVAGAQQLSPPSSAPSCAVSAGLPFNQKDSLRVSWYGQQMTALKEGNLCSQATAQTQVFRFLWIPSFHPSVTVIVRAQGDSHSLRAKRLDGAGGYEPGKLAADTVLPLDSAAWATFTSLLAQSGFLDNRVAPNRMGYDGAQWILEWAGHGRYYYVDRWTPYADGAARSFRRVGEWLLRRSGMVADSLVAGY